MNSNLARLTPQEKLTVQFFYPNLKSKKDEREKEEEYMRRKADKVQQIMESPQSKYKQVQKDLKGFANVSSNLKVLDSVKGYSKGGYMKARGGYMSAAGSHKMAGGLIGALTVAGLTGLVGALGSAFGFNFGNQAYQHISKPIGKTLDKIGDFFKGKGIEDIKVKPSIVKTKNTNPIEYWKSIRKDYMHGTAPFLPKEKRKEMVDKMVKRLGVMRALRMDGSGIKNNKQLKYKHVIRPIMVKRFRKNYMQGGASNEEATDKANEITYAITKMMNDKPIEMNEDHFSTMAKVIKSDMKGGRIEVLSHPIVRKIMRGIMKSLYRYSRGKKYHLRRNMKKYGKMRGFKIPKMKGIKEGSGIVKLIDKMDIDEMDKESLKTIGDIYAARTMKGTYKGGIAKISPKILAQLDHANFNPQHIYQIKKYLKTVGTSEEAVKDLAEKNKSSPWWKKGIALGIGAALLAGLGMLLYKNRKVIGDEIASGIIENAQKYGYKLDKYVDKGNKAYEYTKNKLIKYKRNMDKPKEYEMVPIEGFVKGEGYKKKKINY